MSSSGMIWFLMLTCLSLNCNGLQNKAKWPELWHFIKTLGSQVVAL